MFSFNLRSAEGRSVTRSCIMDCTTLSHSFGISLP